MKKEMKLSVIIMTTLVAINIKAETLTENVTCYMPPLSMKHDANARYDFFSDHSVTIKNETGITQKYHIIYNHDLPNVMGSIPLEFDITLENGKTYKDSRRYNTKITLGVQGVYSSEAITKVINKNKVITNCISNNKINVF